jgi:3-oxoacyl-[acyl-carrier protein] reductase
MTADFQRADTRDAGRTAVVTGGGTGIGRAVAARLAADGYRVAIVGRRVGVLEKAAADIPGLVPLPADLSSPTEIDRLALEVRTALGTVDALVLNAGGAHHGAVRSTADVARHWTATIEQNVLSAVLPTHALRPLLRSPGGRVVVITSASATHAGGEVAYAASKAALNRWVRTVASVLGADGITANALSPGFVPDTELYGPDGADPGWSDRIARGIAVRRVGTPDDVAAAVAYLVSDAAGFISGTVVDVDGGIRVRV